MRVLSVLLTFLGSTAFALGPQHVVVLARADSPDSLRIANAYVEARRIPADHLILLPYKGSPHHCKWEEFERDILKPTRKAIEERKLDKSVHVWATTLGIPWRIDGNGLSGVIHFGKVIAPMKAPMLGPAGFTETNRYAGVWLSIDAFNSLAHKDHRPLHMHLAAGNVDATLAMIKRSAATDGTFPDGTVYLCDGAGPRASRKGSIGQATRFLKALGAKIEHRSDSQFTGRTDVVGLFTGDIRFPTTENTFLPGALADHLTSTGGVLDGTGGQMMCTAFLDAGCSASYGAVVEPYNYPTKFPSAMVHAAYRAGFTAVESYWMSVAWPEQGIFVGDPLARPFGKPPTLVVESPAIEQTIADEIPLRVKASTGKGSGVAGIEVRIDGTVVANLGQQRLPAEASMTLQLGEKKYRSAATAPTVLASLLAELKKQLVDDGFEVAATAASLMMSRPPGGTPATATLSTTSAMLHGEVVGGKFVPGPDGKEFLWLKFSTGPTAAFARIKLPFGNYSDGLHHLALSAVLGDETTASATQTTAVVKRTKPTRLRLKGLKDRISLATEKGRFDAVEAWFQGEGLAVPIEFRIDERVVETRSQPPFVLSLDPKSLGVGRHVVRARTISPVQEADEQIELHIDP
jgi:uncharacterized protein (TIGR03790 family)